MPEKIELNALFLSCTLKRSPEESSTDALLKQVMEVTKSKGVKNTLVRVADHQIRFGVENDMGRGDEWPAIKKQVLKADILVIGTPIWMGHRGSISQMVIERLDALLNEKNEKGQLPLYNKVAGVVVVGNEDGAQFVAEGILYNLMQLGCTIPPNAEVYWVGEAGGQEDYKDAGRKSKYTKKLVQYIGNNLVHLARILKSSPIPAEGNLSE